MSDLPGAADGAGTRDPAGLVTQELVRQVARALSACATGRGYRLHDERFHLARAALTSAAADLYARGVAAGRRECATELRAVSQPAHPAHLIDTDTLLALADQWEQEET